MHKKQVLNVKTVAPVYRGGTYQNCPGGKPKASDSMNQIMYMVCFLHPICHRSLWRHAVPTGSTFVTGSVCYGITWERLQVSRGKKYHQNQGLAGANLLSQLNVLLPCPTQIQVQRARLPISSWSRYPEFHFSIPACSAAGCRLSCWTQVS